MATDKQLALQHHLQSLWTPNPTALDQVISLFTDPVGDNGAFQRQYEQFEILKVHPEFTRYLAYILSQLLSHPIPLRSRAGLELKNRIQQDWSLIAENNREYIKLAVISVLGDNDEFVRKIVGTIISNIAVADKLLHWPDLLHHLISLLDSNNNNLVEGAAGALTKICEDVSMKQLDSEINNRPLNQLIPKLIQLLLSPVINLRKYSLTAINCCLYNEIPQALIVNMDSYLSALFRLAESDTSNDIRKCVCRNLVSLMEIRSDLLLPYIEPIIKYMLTASANTDETIALEACEFWNVYCEAEHSDPALLEKYLGPLVQILLKGMIYTEMDLLMLAADEVEDNQSIPDKESEIKPRFHHSKQSIKSNNNPSSSDNNPDTDDLDSDNDYADDDSEDSSETQNWNLRKCAAASLDTLANIYKDSLLPHLLPLLHQTLTARGSNKETDSTQWVIRESGILALGAVAEGCFNGITAYLPQLIPYLIQLLTDHKPLVRSITCWTISRYSKWIMLETDDSKYFQPLLAELLRRVLDKNKKVQEAGCSSFATLEEEAGDRLIPYLDGILTSLMYAFAKYQSKNLLILYDAIGTLAESVGSHLNRPEYINLLMPPLFNRWNSISDDDRSIFPLLECLTSVAQSLQLGFAPYAPKVFSRCLRIIENTLLVQIRYNSATPQQQLLMDRADKEFIVCSLDLLSGLAEGLQSSIEDLVNQQPQMLVLLYECVKDTDPDVRQSGFAVLGDLSKNCIGLVLPHIEKFIPIAQKNLNPAFASVCNNASWSIGEIAVHLNAELLLPYMEQLLQYLIPIINQNPEQLPINLLENCSIALARLGSICPQQVAQHLNLFVYNWCIYLSSIRENNEKRQAYSGLARVIAANPQSVINPIKHFEAFIQAILAWTDTNDSEIMNVLGLLMHSFKQGLNQLWSKYWNSIPIESRQILNKLYQLE